MKHSDNMISINLQAQQLCTSLYNMPGIKRIVSAARGFDVDYVIS